MIKKRASKKLLAGLGASIAFSTTAFVSGLGVKAIINTVNNDTQELRFNRINEANFSQIPNLSTPTRDMFIDTTRLGNFHAGSVRKGQTLTPWGWLGLYTENNQASSNSRPLHQKLALTAWNGEILWVNDDFQGQSFADNKADIFDIKYDWNTDLIILTRSGNPNGLFKPQQTTAPDENNLMIDVLEAKTGIRLLRIQNGSGNTNDLHNFAWKSFFAIRDNFFNVATDLERIKDLYSLDVTSLNGQQNQALAFYMPNFMQLYQKNQVGSAKTGTLPNFAQVLTDFQTLTRGWVFDRGTNGLTHGTRLVDPRNSSQINGSVWTFNDAFSNKSETLDLANFYLLTNPFWTAGKQTNQFVLHFIVANDAGDTYHKTIGFNLVAPQPNLNTVISEFDKTEKIGSASDNTNQFNIKLKPNEWGNNAVSWHQQFINANLRINKNMFDNNLLTFAFPIAASQNPNSQKNFPLFDVAQIKINDQGLVERSSANNQLSSRVFNLGTQILNSNNLINPWPVINNISPVHNYNRLISVSPFDNTFIYSAMANLQSLSPVYNANDVQNKFLSFWLVNAKTGQYKPFVIGNDAALKGSIPTTIAKIDHLITEGFTFDLKSLDDNGNGSINLYFNHSGTDRNGWFNSPAVENLGFRSAKIGLLDDFLSFSNNWTSDVTSSITGGNNNVVQISDTSFSTLIHSRADLNKWYGRTEFNFERPGNLFKSNEQINASEKSNERVQANVLNQAITDPKVKKQDGVDLVSHWQVGQGKYGGNSSNQTNYERLVVKRPKIKAKNQSTVQTLPIVTSYDVDNQVQTKYENLYQLNSAAKEKLNFKLEQNLTNASWEIFSSWSKDAKITQIGTSSNNLNLTSSLTTISSSPEWFDARKSSIPTGDLFGKIHNAISPNNGTNLSLRTMLQIEKPANAPAWINNANSDFFKPYPIDGSEVANETNFSTVLNQFLAWKVANVDLGQEQSGSASGLANLTIKASLQVNPQIVSNNSQSTFYKKNKQQILLINNEGQAIIYNDKYNDARIVYDQQATEYKQMKDYGFGSNVQTALQKSLTTVPDPTTKLLINLDFNNLNDNLLRNSPGSNEAIFSIDYQSQLQDKIIVKAANNADQAWFVNRFSSFNKMLNLFAVFEYQNKNDNANNSWKQLEGTTEKLWTDDELKNILQQNHNQLILPTDKKDIKKIRVRLVSKTNNGNPTQENDFIKWDNWDANNAKLISSTHIINPQPIKIDKNWFANTVLSSASNNTLDQLSLTDVQNYETLLNNELKQANSNADHLIEQVEIKYQFETQTNLNATELVNAIIGALADTSRNDKGFFTLWNGVADNGLKIKAYFQLKSGSDADFILIDNQGTPITDLENRSGDIKSTIATKIDLSDYFNQLQTNPLKAIKGNQAGQLNSFEMPKANVGKFNNQSYNQIKKILNNVGLDFQFKEWTNNNWSSWMEKDNIANYNPQDPAIIIGLKIEADWNTKVIINSINIDNTYNGIKANLHLPKLIKADEIVWNVFRQANPFSGNTFKLNIDNTIIAEKQLKAKLIDFNESQNPGSDFSLLNQQIEVKYRLGKNGQFLSAVELQKFLEGQNQDQNSNQIFFRLNLSGFDPNQPDFELDSATQAFQELLSDNNTVVKKFLHGAKYEAELDQINVTGADKENLEYVYGPNLQKIVNKDLSVGPLRLEWTYDSNLAADETISGQDPTNQWVEQELPSTVADDVKSLFVRIKNTDNTGLYEYGPDLNLPAAKIKGTIDLSQIATIVRVDKAWISNTAFSATEIDINNLDVNHFEQWKTEVLKKIQINDQELLKEMTFKFSYNGQSNLTANALVAKIKQELQAYDEPNLGIVQLWNGFDKGLNNKISATFVTTKTDSLVKIQDINGSTDEVDLTNDVNTAKVFTNLDLSQYVNILKTKKTKVTPKGTVRPEQISDFMPPAGEDTSGFLNGKSYDQIVNRLKAVGVTIKFSKEINQPNWQDKNQIIEYNPRNNKLFLLFSNANNNNLKISIGQEQIQPGGDSKNVEIGLPLAVPRQITLDKTTDLAGFEQLVQFNGDTKNLSYNEAGSQSIVERILKRNALEANNDQEYLKAPLKVKFAIGNTNQYYGLEQNELKDFLTNLSDDLTNRQIRWKFELATINQEEWIFSPDTVNAGLEGILTTDQDSPLKIYINDKELYQDLQKPSLQGSTSANLQINWNAHNIKIDPTSGLLSATEANNTKPRGVGLRVEFTFKDSFTGSGSEAVDNDPFQGWSSKTPTTFNPNISTKLSIRIRLEDETKYIYDKINQKFTIDLSQIPAVIDLDGQWLQKAITNQIIALDDLNKTHFEEYEKLVWQAGQLGTFDQARVKIAYTFMNQDYLNLDDLINAIQEFKTSQANQSNLGILQLWNNQNSGQKITTKFVKVDQNDPKYELNIVNDNLYDLDFSQVVTTIDFSNVLSWLAALEIEIKELANNGISSLIIPDVAVADPYFANQTWPAVEAALKTFGLTIEYARNFQNQAPNWGPITNVDQYDPTNPSFQIHFKTNGSESSNIKLKLSATETLDGSTPNTSSAQVIKIKAKLLVQINQQLKNAFEQNALFSGNTKELEITQVLNAQNQLIDQIIAQNVQIDSRYEKLQGQLEIEYILQKNTPNDQSDWLSLNQLQSSLGQATNDQTTNQIWYRIKLKDLTNFRISAADEQSVILNAHQDATALDLKIAYYINNAQWETKASKIAISGPTDALIWNFSQIFATEIVEKNNQVYLRNAAGEALQVYFTLNEQATYTNPVGFSDSLSDLPTKWVSIKPNQISAGTKNLKIKLVATKGFVYGPAQNPAKAQAHNVAINVQNVIFVNKDWFSAPFLTQATEIKDLTKADFENWENQIYQQIQTQNNINDQTIARTVKIKYLLQNQKYNLDDLLAEIVHLTTNYSDGTTLGILQLWNSQSKQGIKIEAIFELEPADQQAYILKVAGQSGIPGTSDLQGLINTDKVYTLISLIEYIDVLEQSKTTVELKNNGANAGQIQSFNPPGMSGQIGQQFLSGYTYEQIAQRLEAIGLQIKFAKTASTNPTDWLEKNQVNEYDIQTSVLFLSFEIKPTATNVKVEYANNQLLNPGENMYGTKAVKLRLDVPKYIIIDDQQAFWQTIKDDFAFSGNTKFLDFDEAQIKAFINKILQQNFAASNDNDYLNAPLKIAFQIGNLEFQEIDHLKAYLQDQENDLSQRTINFKFIIPDDQGQNWKLQNPDQVYSLLSAQDTAQLAKIKIYINDKGIFSDLRDKTKLSGTSQNLVWKFFGDLQIDETNGILSANNRGQGLKVEFTFNTAADPNGPTGQDVNTEWVAEMPKSFNINQDKVFLRLALVNSDLYHYDKINEKISLSLSDIVVVLNLESDWLKQIQLGGNTKNLTVNETAVLNQLTGILPANKPNLIQLQYSVDGKKWQTVNDFKSFLQAQSGKKDDLNFILKRQDLQVRFALNATAQEQAKFQMNIDGLTIKPDNTNSPIIKLIDDQNQPPLNQSVQGYIEIDHLKHFVVANFGIEGSNTKPRLKIKQKEQMETLMQVYATDQLFDILITGKKDHQGQWDFSENISLLTTGNQFISDAELIKRGFTLDTNKNVAIKFIIKDTKYDLYQNGNQQPDGHILDISANVKITFEIENPFVKQNKTLALWWTENQDKTQGKYFQGQGGFKIVNGNQDGTVDEADFQSALAWLNSANSGLDSKEKAVLEFVYHIYDGEPSEQEIAQVGLHENIVDYEGTIWKPLAPDLDSTNNDHFTNPLGLKVGQYVSVALRVKKEYASGLDVYTLKDNEHSFMAPISANKNLSPGRAHGYKVQSSALEIETDSITLENMLNSDQLPLDGYTNIKRLNLKKDQLSNFAGVDLKLQLFHEFHQNNTQPGVIITPFDKIKLVKREDNNLLNDRYFKDSDGNLIRDDQGQPIPILLDDQGKPTAPQGTNNPIESQFDNYGEGIFGISIPHNDTDRNRWGIFKNEAVKVVFSAQLGRGGIDDPDFILDQQKEIDLKDQISPQIKFPLFNQDNIKYEFNQADFSKEKVQFENATNANEQAIDGKSKVKTLIQLSKTTNINPDVQIISGQNAETAVTNLKTELQTAFNGKLRFETTYEKSDGGTEIRNDLDLYKFGTLKNNDRLKVRIVSADEDFIWAEPPKPLTIQVSGLTAKAPNRNQLQFLRVEQNGEINGQGSFRVLINDPEKPQSDANEKLEGWKFVLRVWDSKQQIKQDWTDDQNKITNLNNGDKIEWKLVDQFNNPVSDPYYNTVAGTHELNSDGSIKLIFNQVNYLNGTNSAEIVNQGIGQYPNNPDAYPENSGFVISGLKEKFEIFEISEKGFTKVINKLEPHYVGVNGQGRINFNATYLDNNYYVNTDGELYEKPTNRLANQQLKANTNEIKEISLDEFLANVTFYTSDPNLVGYQNGFKFVDNETNVDNQLHNGDQIWAQFDLLANNNEVNQGINVALGPVSGLQEVVTDQMSTLWYVMMALGGIVTLGGLTALVALLRRHKKLKR